jgi:hypothetical protein
VNDYLIYETTMQVVPLLLIALFVDRRGSAASSPGLRSRRWARAQDRIIAVLGFVAFFVSMFVLSQSIAHNSVTLAIVIAALSGSIGMLFGLIWTRFGSSGAAEGGSARLAGSGGDDS